MSEVKEKSIKSVEKFDLKGIESPEVAMEKMGCKWEAQPVELMTMNGIEVPNHKAIVRSDSNFVLGVVGKDYTPTQLPTYFSQFHSLVEQVGLTYHSGVVFDGGKRLLLKAKFPHKTQVRVGDSYESELNWVTSFDGSLANNGWFSILRLVCSNGLTASSKNRQFYCKHTKNSESLIVDKMQVLLKSKAYFEEFKQNSKNLANTVADKQRVDKFIKDMFGDVQKESKKGSKPGRKKNQINEVKRLFRHGMGNGQGTLWDLYNGYTEWIDHHRTPDESKRYVSATLGNGANLKEKAYNKILTLV